MKQRLLQYNPKTSRNLKFDAVPVLNLPCSTQKRKNMERFGRIAKRRRQSIVSELLKESFEPQPSTSNEGDQVSGDTPMNTLNVETLASIDNPE